MAYITVQRGSCLWRNKPTHENRAGSGRRLCSYCRLLLLLQAAKPRRFPPVPVALPLSNIADGTERSQKSPSFVRRRVEVLMASNLSDDGIGALEFA
jgi:hypothetical protein